ADDVARKFHVAMHDIPKANLAFTHLQTNDRSVTTVHPLPHFFVSQRLTGSWILPGNAGQFGALRLLFEFCLTAKTVVPAASLHQFQCPLAIKIQPVALTIRTVWTPHLRC